MATQIAGQGTSEATWRPFLDRLTLPELDLPEPSRPEPSLPELGRPDLPMAGPGSPLVVAPHPDDEVLGVGGLLALLGRAEVVAVTDGEASHPRSTVYGQPELAAIRRRETTDSLARLGLAHVAIHRLGQPDGAIDEDDLAADLVQRLSPGRWCLATWREDGHPDHEAVGRAAARACELTGARLVEYPVWMWHWSTPGDPRVPWHRARRISLDEQTVARKTVAIAAFASQVSPIGPDPDDAAILPPNVVARFTRPYEVVFV